MRKTKDKKGKEVIKGIAPVVIPKPKKKLGRPIVMKNEGEEILPSGLFKRQWEWIQQEAPANQQFGAQYLRWAIDMHIASIEASRTNPDELEKQLSSK